LQPYVVATPNYGELRMVYIEMTRKSHRLILMEGSEPHLETCHRDLAVPLLGP